MANYNFSPNAQVLYNASLPNNNSPITLANLSNNLSPGINLYLVNESVYNSTTINVNIFSNNTTVYQNTFYISPQKVIIIANLLNIQNCTIQISNIGSNSTSAYLVQDNDFSLVNPNSVINTTIFQITNNLTTATNSNSGNVSTIEALQSYVENLYIPLNAEVSILNSNIYDLSGLVDERLNNAYDFFVNDGTLVSNISDSVYNMINEEVLSLSSTVSETLSSTFSNIDDILNVNIENVVDKYTTVVKDLSTQVSNMSGIIEMYPTLLDISSYFPSLSDFESQLNTQNNLISSLDNSVNLYYTDLNSTIDNLNTLNQNLKNYINSNNSQLTNMSDEVTNNYNSLFADIQNNLATLTSLVIQTSSYTYNEVESILFDPLNEQLSAINNEIQNNTNNIDEINITLADIDAKIYSISSEALVAEQLANSINQFIDSNTTVTALSSNSLALFSELYALSSQQLTDIRDITSTTQDLNDDVTNLQNQINELTNSSGAVNPSNTIGYTWDGPQIVNGTISASPGTSGNLAINYDQINNGTLIPQFSQVKRLSNQLNQNWLPNSSFLFGTQGWSGATSDMSISTNNNFTYINYNGVSTSTQQLISSNITNSILTTGGFTINLSAWINNAEASANAVIELNCYDSSDSLISSIASSSVTTGEAWTFVSNNGVIPSNTTYVQVVFSFAGNASGSNISLSQIKLENGNYPTLWSDESSSIYTNNLISDVSSLSSQQATDKTNINSLSSQQQTNMTNISTLSSDISTIDSDLTTIDSNVSSLSSNVSSLSSQQETDKTNISSLSSYAYNQLANPSNTTGYNWAGIQTYPGGLIIQSFGGGSWINMPTTGPSAIGSGGAGNSAWIGYASNPGAWFTDSVTGDICYRGSNALLFGFSPGTSTVQMTSGGINVNGNITSTNINSLSSQQQTNMTNISTLSSDVSTIDSDLTTIDSNVSSLSSDVSSLSSQQETDKTNINSLSSQQQINTTNIETLSSDVSTIDSNVSSLSSQQETDKTNINSLSSQQQINTTNISTLSSDVSTIDSDLTTIDSNVSSLSSDVSSLSSQQETDKTNINSLSSNSVTITQMTNGTLSAVFNSVTSNIYNNSPYDISGGFAGTGTSNQTILQMYITRNVTFPGNFSGSGSYVGTSFTNATTYTIEVNGSSVGTLVFGAGVTGTSAGSFTSTSGATVNINSGEILKVVGPATADTTGGNVSFTLQGGIV